MSRATASQRLIAFTLDWFIWTYVLAAGVYFFRNTLAAQSPVVFGRSLDAGTVYVLSAAVGFELAGLAGSLGVTIGQQRVGWRVDFPVTRTLGDSGSLLVTLPRRLLRFLTWNVGLLPFGLGTLWMLWDREGRAWHDHLSYAYLVSAGAPVPAPWYRTHAGWLTAGLLVETLVLGWQVTEVDLYRLVTQAGKIGNVTRFLVRPNWAAAPRVIDAMIETIFLALMSTAFAIPAAFVLSFFAARNLMLPLRTRLDAIVGAVLFAIAGVWVGSQTSAVLPWGGSTGGSFTSTLLALLLQIAGLIGGALFGARLFRRSIPRFSLGFGRAVVALSAALIGVGVMRVAVDWTVTIALGSFWSEFYELFPGVSLALLALGGVAFGWSAVRRAPSDSFPTGQVIYYGVRTLLNLIRSVEPLIWAIIFVVWVRVGPFPGMLALTVHSIAALAKLYSEQVESIDHGPVEAIQATGANGLQTVVYGVIPQIMPSYIAFTIYRWDINVRMSTIIGMVGGGGIGQRLQQAMQLSQWREAGLVIFLIVVVVMSLDFISAKVREGIK